MNVFTLFIAVQANDIQDGSKVGGNKGGRTLRARAFGGWVHDMMMTLVALLSRRGAREWADCYIYIDDSVRHSEIRIASD